MANEAVSAKTAQGVLASTSSKRCSIVRRIGRCLTEARCFGAPVGDNAQPGSEFPRECEQTGGFDSGAFGLTIPIFWPDDRSGRSI